MSKKTLLKLGLFSAIMFGLWRLWENDAAINAFILFCTAGVVPGTTTELTPEQVYMVLGSVLFLSIMAIFSKELLRDMRAVRNAWRHRRQKAKAPAVLQATPGVVAVKAVVAHHQAVPAPAKAEKITEPQPVVAIVMPARPGRFVVVWRAVRPRLVIAAGASLEFLLKTADRGAVQASRASLRMYGYGMQAWLRAEPHLRRFDRWLEQTLKSNKDIAALLHVWSELLKSAGSRFAELRARIARTPRAPEE